jgi:hypothetical protein
MNENQKTQEQIAAEPQETVGDPKQPDQTPQNAPGQDQPAKIGEPSPDRDTSNPSGSNEPA